MNLGAPELILIFLVILVLFGAKKIPDLAKGLGTGVKEFRKAMKDVQDTAEEDSKKTEVKK
jgi:sec-independent protein translocase protein TatA